MSIADKLTKLTEDITSAYEAVETKGGTIPSDKNTENLADAIFSISGGGVPEKTEWGRVYYTEAKWIIHSGGTTSFEPTIEDLDKLLGFFGSYPNCVYEYHDLLFVCSAPIFHFSKGGNTWYYVHTGDTWTAIANSDNDFISLTGINPNGANIIYVEYGGIASSILKSIDLTEQEYLTVFNKRVVPDGERYASPSWLSISGNVINVAQVSHFDFGTQCESVPDGFLSYSSIKSLDIPDNVTEIGEEFLFGSTIQIVNIPSSLVRIGEKFLFQAAYLQNLITAVSADIVEGNPSESIVVAGRANFPLVEVGVGFFGSENSSWGDKFPTIESRRTSYVMS